MISCVILTYLLLFASASLATRATRITLHGYFANKAENKHRVIGYRTKQTLQTKSTAITKISPSLRSGSIETIVGVDQRLFYPFLRLEKRGREQAVGTPL
ncbi:hypothetical protein HD806DRAFT_509930 [Xylariaceae sp. AK1471]|nr:hypothetical protein HD806DRAFT_509930 [Xylariaceae sp. AK1471]